MKKLLILSLTLLLSIPSVNAQTNNNLQHIFKNNLPSIYLSDDINLHFRTPEPVQFVDLSTSKLIGDLPTENIVRIKLQKNEDEKVFINDTLQTTKQNEIVYTPNEDLGIVTIVGQSFMAQYQLIYKSNTNFNLTTNIEVLPNHMQPLEFPNYDLSTMEMKRHSMYLISQKIKKPIAKEKNLKMQSILNNVYTMGDYIFLDVTFKNETNLSYDIEQLKFSIDDKKVYKATNIQSIDIEPIYQLYNNTKFKKAYRNVYVFKKFTYPNNKVLNIRLIENQMSGRTINLQVKYSDILQADTF